LITYRHAAREQAIFDEWERAKVDITAGMSASSETWDHYIQALNILFLLIESELHQHGRNSQIFWIEPVVRTEVVRVRCDESGDCIATSHYGPRGEMAHIRSPGAAAVGMLADGNYYQEVLDAFLATEVAFARAHASTDLWAFLDIYSSAWTLFQLGHLDAALMLAWSLIERDLVRQIQDLLAVTTPGTLKVQRPGTTTSVAMGAKEERKHRDSIAAGKSPMAGVLLGILTGNGVSPSPDLIAAKSARDRLAHAGAAPSTGEARSGLMVGREICQRVFGLALAARLHENPHLGLTP